MRHIEIVRYGEPPCGGEVRLRPRAPRPGDEARRRSLPLLGAPPRPTEEWACAGCGRTWDREPLPDEAL